MDPSHVLKGHSFIAQGSPLSGYPGLGVAGSIHPYRGWLEACRRDEPRAESDPLKMLRKWTTMLVFAIRAASEPLQGSGGLVDVPDPG